MVKQGTYLSYSDCGGPVNICRLLGKLHLWDGGNLSNWCLVAATIHIDTRGRMMILISSLGSSSLEVGERATQ